MRHPLFPSLLLAALALMAGACGSDDVVGGDDVTPPVPVDPATPEYLTPGTDQRPTWWVAPDYTSYGGITMALQVELGDTLHAYQGADDLMCATIGGEVRAVTSPRSTGGIIYYPLSIAGENGGLMVSLHYYCHQLHRIFTIPEWASFAPATPPIGQDAIHRPRFTDYFTPAP